MSSPFDPNYNDPDKAIQRQTETARINNQMSGVGRTYGGGSGPTFGRIVGIVLVIVLSVLFIRNVETVFDVVLGILVGNDRIISPLSNSNTNFNAVPTPPVGLKSGVEYFPNPDGDPGLTAPRVRIILSTINRDTFGGIPSGVSDANKELINNQIQEVIDSGQLIMQCSYGPLTGVDQKAYFHAFTYWYESEPENLGDMIEATGLTSPNHPFHRISSGGAITECPDYETMSANFE